MEAVAAAGPICPRKLSFSDGDVQITSTDSQPERMRAYVRLRPLAGSEVQSAISVTDCDCTISMSKVTAQGSTSVEDHTFTFDGVFGSEASQSQVFSSAMQPQVQALLAGRDTLTFAYGITNAGKTYTIQGDATEACMGVLPRALKAIFGALAEHAQRKGEVGTTAWGLDLSCEYQVHASFLEVYGSDVYDLLADRESRRVLRLKEAQGRVQVEGLLEADLPDLETAQNAVQSGWQNRQSASNGVNDDSSRSHAVLCIKLMCTSPGTTKPKVTRLHVVDLAGAERQKNTQSTGSRLHEANHINKDLLVLGSCLRDLRWNQAHPKGTQKIAPYRDSRITMLFRDYLSGLGETVVIAAVNPRAVDASSTLETLRFASVAVNIKTNLMPPPAVPKLPVRKAGHRAAPSRASSFVERDEPSAVDSARSSSEWGHGTTASDYALLQEKVYELQERISKMTDERVGIERQIREEVSAEMRQHISETEDAMMQRLEEAQYSTEEAYMRKLKLVKNFSDRKAGEASAQAHEDMLKLYRTTQTREAEASQRLATAESELASTKAELTKLRQGLAGDQAEHQAAVEDARTAMAVGQLQDQLREATEARDRLEGIVRSEALARATAVEERNKADAAKQEAVAETRKANAAAAAAEAAAADACAKARSQLEAANAQIALLRKENDGLGVRLANLEALRSSQESGAHADAGKSSDSSPSPKRPLGEITQQPDAASGAGSPSKRNRSSVGFGKSPEVLQRENVGVVLVEGAAKASPVKAQVQGKLKALRSSMFRGKKNETVEFADLARTESELLPTRPQRGSSLRRSASKPDVSKSGKPEPTPVSRRTRGASRRSVA